MSGLWIPVRRRRGLGLWRNTRSAWAVATTIVRILATIKDNHIDALRSDGMSLGDVVKKAIREASHTIRVEVEVENLEQLDEALDAGAGIVLLDNMDVEQMAAAVHLAKGREFTEASGGITLETVRDVAGTGVDIISIGALTHSVRALDISMDMVH